MWGYARHPNVAGVLMVGLGCEMNQIDWLLEAYGITPGPLFQAMNIQDVAGLRRTIEIGSRRSAPCCRSPTRRCASPAPPPS